MRFSVSRAIFFLILTLAFFRPGRAAELTDASLQGNYSFVLYKVDTSVLGFVFSSAFGTIAFNGTGGAFVQGTINRAGSIQVLNSSATYSLDSQGGFQLSIPNFPATVSGSVSYDLDSILATDVAGPSALTQEILLAVRQPAALIDPASLSGRYFLVQQTVTDTGGTPRRENSSGTIHFDGAGSYTLEERLNRNGFVTTVNSSGTYQVTNGNVALNFAGRPSPVTLAFTPSASFGVGTTMDELLSNVYNLFVLNKADAAGLGNAGLGGAFQMAVSGVDPIEGFSTSAGRALYFGDGTASYELQRKRQGGVVESAGGDSTFEVAADGAVQFGAVPDVSNVLQGGLGDSVRNFAAAAVSDPTVHNLLVAVRTPSAPAAASNAASFLETRALSPGALFSLFGTNLARETLLASSLPLPRQMGGATVKINGIEAPLHFVSPFQINAQVPFEVSPGTAQITVALDGAEGRSLSVPVNAAGPGIFTRSLDGQGAGIFLHGSDFGLVTESNPARPGEVVLIYGTGFGSVVPIVPSGEAAPDDFLANVTTTVTVQIDGRDAEVSFAGLAPGFAGLYQLNVRIPPDVSPASNVPVVVNIAGVPSNSVTIPVAP